MTTETLIQNIIDNDIYANASMMVTELTQGDLAQFDEELQDNLMSCLDAPDVSEPPEDYKVLPYEDEEVGALFRVVFSGEDTITDGHETEAKAIRAAWDDACEEPENRIEALQHWLVSDKLADELEEIGALVARDILGFNIWGRTECGQSLTEDADVKRVAALIQARIDNL